MIRAWLFDASSANIENVANIMKSGEDGIQLDGSEFDTLFDIYLRPLKSKNTRTIFKVLVKNREAGSLTTFDIQARLEKDGIELSKKEINGWLRSLQAAGLVSKEAERGKPTTIEYDDKYTFGLWRLTDLGAKIAEGLPNLLKTKSFLHEENAMNTLEELATAEATIRTRTLKRLDELSTLVKTLVELLESGGELQTAKLKKRLVLKEDELDKLLSNYSKPSWGPALVVRKPSRQSLKARFLSIFGISPKRDASYTLTEEGRRLAETLRSEEDGG